MSLHSARLPSLKEKLKEEEAKLLTHKAVEKVLEPKKVIKVGKLGASKKKKK